MAFAGSADRDHRPCRHGRPDVTVDQLSAQTIRDAFGAFSSSHAKTSTSRCWSTWNQFFTFLVGDGVRSTPKPLQGEDTPETLLRSAALPRPNARHPWPERDLAILATLQGG